MGREELEEEGTCVIRRVDWVDVVYETEGWGYGVSFLLRVVWERGVILGS